MATAIYICPQCGCPDLQEPKASAIVLPAKERQVQCPNCKWEGVLAEAAGIATTERVYDTKAVLNLLLHVVTKHAAGPVAQALAFIGLLDPKDQAGLDHIMREATTGMIERAFVAAAEVAAAKGKPISVSSTVAAAAEEKQTCPWCGGRHILDEDFDLGGSDGRCKKCSGTGELTATQIAEFDAAETRP